MASKIKERKKRVVKKNIKLEDDRLSVNDVSFESPAEIDADYQSEEGGVICEVQRGIMA